MANDRTEGHNARVPPAAIDPALARVLHRLRAERGLSQQAISSLVGLTMGTWAKLERAESNPTWTTVRTIAEGLGMTITELAALVEAEGNG
jgi:transcriptional regulator with XRE-family HTH domain